MHHMGMSLNHEKITLLESVIEGPCLSLYQETHRTSPDNIQDPIRFRNLVKLLMVSLHEKYPQTESQGLLEPLESLANDSDFWAHTRDGLVVLVRAGQFHIFCLQHPVPELAVAEDVFILGPLRQYLQSIDRFQILGLGLHDIKLYEGNRNNLDEITPESGVPITISSVLGDDLKEIGKSVSSHSGIGSGTTPSRHGYSDKQNEIDIDTEKYFRAVDKAVLQYHSRTSSLPLILSCLPEHQHLFHQISNNPFLLENGLGINPETLPINELKERAWKFMEPIYKQKLTMLSDEYNTANAKGLGSDDIKQIYKAAADGKVATLLLDQDRLNEEESSKTIEDLSELVGRMGGIVQIIPFDHISGKTGMAASYRY